MPLVVGAITTRTYPATVLGVPFDLMLQLMQGLFLQVAMGIIIPFPGFSSSPVCKLHPWRYAQVSAPAVDIILDESPMGGVHFGVICQISKTPLPASSSIAFHCPAAGSCGLRFVQTLLELFHLLSCWSGARRSYERVSVASVASLRSP